MPNGFIDDPTSHDPGGKAYLPKVAGITYNAGFSPCTKYRHWLSRNWSLRQVSDGRCDPWALWIGMNPSVAGGDFDDPTVRREMAFTRKFGIDVYVKVNVMDYRSTFPDKLLEPGVAPRSPDNLRIIAELAAGSSKIIACWGVLPKALRHYADDVVAALAGKPLFCLGTTADGSPRHPLYVHGGTDLIPWSGVNPRAAGGSGKT